MNNEERNAFAQLVVNVYAFYAKEASDFALGVWWQAMRPFDFAAVTEAINRHCVNPDAGQFLPKPADIVRMLGGSTQDAALRAWSEVDRAVRSIGPYVSVRFDDALIAQVILDMGGWIRLCSNTEKEWPFVAREFENRYRGYRMRSEVPENVPRLTGIFAATNRLNGYEYEEVAQITNANRTAPQIAQAFIEKVSRS